MEKDKVSKALKQLREEKKRKFTQGVDLIINLQAIDLKKPENHIDLFLELPNGKAKPNKVCAFVGPELAESAKENCDSVVMEKDFEKYKADKKLVKKLAEDYDVFIAQATVMAKIAGIFGRVLGSRKKMPNPKAGCVVPPKANLKPLVEKLRQTIKMPVKDKLYVQASVGNESMTDDQIIDNIMSAYNALLHKLPNEKNNIKNIYLKLTMSKPVKVE